MLDLFRQQREGREVPRQIREYIEQQQRECRPCAEHAELPRVPKLAIPHPASPNIAVTLDVMPHYIKSTQRQILFILDAGDMMLRLCNLRDNSARTAFDAYFSRCISIFGAPTFTVEERGSNLANKHMADSLRTLDSQLCPISTEAPWSIGSNERSLRFLRKEIDSLLADPKFDPGHDLTRLLAEVEIVWNCTQHTNRILPHLHRFGLMSRVLGELDNSPTTRERIALMELLRTETERLRAEKGISSAINSLRRQVTSLQHFHVEQNVWFYRRKFGWRKGQIARIDRPTVYISYESNIFPTRENRVRPFFGDISLPPEIRLHDEPNSNLFGRLSPSSSTEIIETTHNRAPISALLNPNFCTSPPQPNPYFFLPSHEPFHTFVLHDPMLGIIDSDAITTSETTLTLDIDLTAQPNEGSFLTSLENVSRLTDLPQEQQQEFRTAKADEVRLLLKDAITPIQQHKVEPHCELQPLKWILGIKRSTNSSHYPRYRERLVSASHLSSLQYSLNGNAFTVATSTIRILLSLAPTWSATLRSPGDSLLLLVRDVTKAYPLALFTTNPLPNSSTSIPTSKILYGKETCNCTGTSRRENIGTKRSSHGYAPTYSTTNKLFAIRPFFTAPLHLQLRSYVPTTH